MDTVRDPELYASVKSCDAIRHIEAAKPHPFEATARLALRLLQTPIALVSIIDEDRDRQFFKACPGLADPWHMRGQTPLSHSFCRHVKRLNCPLVISDARRHPMLRDNLAIAEMGVLAYLGVPVFAVRAQPLGALCVIDSRPRVWNPRDINLLNDLAIGLGETISALGASATGALDLVE